MNKNYFEGLYFKHQQQNQIISLIPGCSKQNAFIQIITEENSYQIEFPLSQYAFVEANPSVLVGNNHFTSHGIQLHIQRPGLSLMGQLAYQKPVPLEYDVMGPFALLPMQCSHRVVSLYHTVRGELVLNGKPYNFSNGVGYIEGDKGSSFPQDYTWLHCNDFPSKSSLMLAIAHIPFGNSAFTGCLCTLLCQGKQYRLATYTGVRIVEHTPRLLVLQQGCYTLRVELAPTDGHPLLAPEQGSMNRIIRESLATRIHCVFSRNGTILWDETSDNASYEDSHQK